MKPQVQVIADPGACWRIPGEPWDRSWNRMEQLIDATADAGAQVFKAQVYTADTLYPQGSAEHALLRPYELPHEWLADLSEYCAACQIEFMCTVYTPEHVELIDPYVKRFKVASFENQHTALLEAMRATKKPIIISLGGLDKPYWEALPDWWRQATLLHCVSAYPATPESMNLRFLFDANHYCEWNYDFADSGWCPDGMGLSDHTTTTTAAIMAVAYGAPVIEHHIRAIDTPISNPDYAHSASPLAFDDYVKAIREVEAMLGDGVKTVHPTEEVQWRFDPKTGKRGIRK